MTAGTSATKLAWSLASLTPQLTMRSAECEEETLERACWLSASNSDINDVLQRPFVQDSLPRLARPNTPMTHQRVTCSGRLGFHESQVSAGWPARVPMPRSNVQWLYETLLSVEAAETHGRKRFTATSGRPGDPVRRMGIPCQDITTAGLATANGARMRFT